MGSFGQQHLAFLALSSIKGVGSKTLASIADAGTSFNDVLDVEEQGQAIELLKRYGARIDGASGAEWKAVREQAIGRAHRLIEGFIADGTVLVFRDDPVFPQRLLDLPSPPHWLFVRGNVEALSLPSIAIVGTREPSGDGEWLARFVGACLSSWGAATVSGLAMGIDQLVHEASIRAKVPTIAFLGTGILSDYPRGAAELREKMIDGGGALATEYLPRESYSADNFVRRNRLQAALGRALVPVEWNPRSGTAHTVRFASQLRRPIAFLKMPDWPADRVVPTKGSGAETGRVFVIPGEEPGFRGFVESALDGKVVTEGGVPSKPQLSLFSDG